MKDTYTYFGMLFSQRPGAPQSVLFLSPAEDIQDWGGVPRKSATFLTGFQRAIEADRVADITEFFDKEAKNISPTAVVVAFKPNVLRIIELQESKHGDETVTMIGKPVLIEVLLTDYSEKSVEELAEAVASKLKQEAGAHQVDDADNDKQDVELVIASPPTEAEDSEGLEEELTLGSSHLRQFVDQLTSKEWISEQKAVDEPKLRTLLIDLLKPAMIVDGQHRVEGAADIEDEIPFPVVGLVDADWKEDVFHFVVINQKARPIRPEFLSAIISSSLSDDDIEQLKDRLEQAGINLVDTQIMDLVHTDPDSPFREMIDFKISGAEGKLKFTGMLQLAKRFRRLGTHKPETRFSTFFKQTFKDACKGKNYGARRANWLDEVWFKYFTIFWKTVREKICDEKHGFQDLWEPGSNLMKVVTLQELQNLFLQWLFDKMEPVKEKSFRKSVETFLQNIKGRFFTDKWALPSLQSQTGRKYLREALNNAVKNPAYKYDDALFKGVSET